MLRGRHRVAVEPDEVFVEAGDLYRSVAVDRIRATAPDGNRPPRSTPPPVVRGLLNALTAATRSPPFLPFKRSNSRNACEGLPNVKIPY